MTFSGDLRGISLADVFQNVASNRSSGWMTVEWRQRSCHVRFADGAVNGFSLEGGDALVTPEFLVQRGYVAAEDMQRLVKKHRRSRKTVCQLAVAAKLLGIENVVHAAITRIEEHVFDLMLLREATFQFHEGVPPTGLFDPDQHEQSIRLEVGPLLMEGARRRDEWENIRRLVGTEHDLVVLLEGWEDVELEALAAEVAPLLDGRTDARAMLQLVAASRFEIMKAMAELVQLGVARLAGADEIEVFADEAREEGDVEECVRLLQQALTHERSNADLRQKLIDALVELDRPKDAAAELAKIAHHVAAAGRVNDALAMYARAFELDPEDVPLLEQRVELLKTTPDSAALVVGVRELTRVYLDIGAADRARTALRDALTVKALKGDESLLELLAAVESSLGHWAESARIYRQLGEACLSTDEARGLEFMRTALEQTPDDSALAARISDVESGRADRRSKTRRRVSAIGGTAAAVLAILMMGIADFRAARRVMDAFDGALSIDQDRDAIESLELLDSVRHDAMWSPTKSRAIALFERLADRQLAAVDAWISNGDYARARDVLEKLEQRITREDVVETCRQLLGRIDAEERAAATLQRADRQGNPATEDLEQLASLTDLRYLEFHLSHLPRIENGSAARAVLRALVVIDNPRAIPHVARMFLTEQDDATLTLMREMFAKAKRFGEADRESWRGLREELDAAALVAETAGRAHHLLELLF